MEHIVFIIIIIIILVLSALVIVGMSRGWVSLLPGSARASDNHSEERELNTRAIFRALCEKGLKPSIIDSWIVFRSQGCEYAIDTSRLPVFAILKQTAIDSMDADRDVTKKIALELSSEIILAKVHVTHEASARAIFQVDAIENSTQNFDKRLDYYIEILNNAEARFFHAIA